MVHARVESEPNKIIMIHAPDPELLQRALSIGRYHVRLPTINRSLPRPWWITRARGYLHGSRRRQGINVHAWRNDTHACRQNDDAQCSKLGIYRAYYSQRSIPQRNQENQQPRNGFERCSSDIDHSDVWNPEQPSDNKLNTMELNIETRYCI